MLDVISIVDFFLFDNPSFYSRFQLLETSRHELLTDRCSLVCFELKKHPEIKDRDERMHSSKNFRPNSVGVLNNS